MRLKVGDKLKVLKDAHWNTALKRGDIITIEEIVGEVFHTNGRWAFTDTPDCMQGFELVEEKGKPYTIKGKTYYAFPEGKTIKELGIDTSRKFIVLDETCCSSMFKVGQIVSLSRDDDTVCPFFIEEDGTYKKACLLNGLAYYDEEETPLRADGETRFSGIQFYRESMVEKSLQIKANNLMPTGNKFMSNIVKFAKDTALAVSNPDEKLRREVGLKDDSGNWTIEAKEIVMNLEAQALGFKGIEDFCNAMGITTGSVFFTAFEAYNLLVKYDTQLLDIAKAKKAEDKK